MRSLYCTMQAKVHECGYGLKVTLTGGTLAGGIDGNDRVCMKLVAVRLSCIKVRRSRNDENDITG